MKKRYWVFKNLESVDGLLGLDIVRKIVKEDGIVFFIKMVGVGVIYGG